MRANHPLQRTGGQRRIAAWDPQWKSVVDLPPPLSFRVAMTSDVKNYQQIFLGLHDVFVLGASEEPEPVSIDG
jgi:hypothetical protein